LAKPEAVDVKDYACPFVGFCATPSATPTAITAINFRCLFMVCPFCCFAVLLFAEAERIKIAFAQREAQAH
jgi:hypothetical protein